jgi:hypothetical protein
MLPPHSILHSPSRTRTRTRSDHVTLLCDKKIQPPEQNVNHTTVSRQRFPVPIAHRCNQEPTPVDSKAPTAVYHLQAVLLMQQHLATRS